MELEKNKEPENFFIKMIIGNKDDKEKIKKYREEILNVLLKNDQYEAEYILFIINIFVLKNSLV